MEQSINFMQLAINEGWGKYPKDLNPNNNWFGVSLYYPNVGLRKGNKMIVLSLQGSWTPFSKEIINEYEVLIKNRSIKYIGFYIDKKPIYQSYTGELPDENFINNFIIN